MTAPALPALYALFVWWFSTGAILFLDGLPQRSFRWSIAGATVLLGGAVYGLAVSRADASSTGAYVAFTSGLMVWAWLEMTYYMGFVTGPRRRPCPENCTGWRHFGHAIMSSLYHELLTIALAGVLYGATRGAANGLGLWTFLILWGMQISAKLNVFLGVPNVSEEFLPDHLSFLRGFLNKKPMNLLFPFSMTGSVVLATCLVQRAVAAASGSFDFTAMSILAALALLGVLEHWFLVLPIKAEALWRWSLASRGTQGTSDASEQNATTCQCKVPHFHHPAPPVRLLVRWFGQTPFDRLTGRKVAEQCLVDPRLQSAQPSLARRPQ